MLLLFELGYDFFVCAAAYQLIPITVLAILTIRRALGNCTPTRSSFGRDNQPLC